MFLVKAIAIGLLYEIYKRIPVFREQMVKEEAAAAKAHGSIDHLLPDTPEEEAAPVPSTAPQRPLTKLAHLFVFAENRYTFPLEVRSNGMMTDKELLGVLKEVQEFIKEHE